jgi:DNA-binding transcriptional ArsR family regulator
MALRARRIGKGHLSPRASKTTRSLITILPAPAELGPERGGTLHSFPSGGARSGLALPSTSAARPPAARRLASKLSANAAALERNARSASNLLKAMSNQRRLMIMCELLRGAEVSVGDMAQRVGIGQSALSQHLARLRHLGLVGTRREAQTIYYSLNSREAIMVLSALYDAFCATPKANGRARRR